jgi:D-glycero-D-manno-heptose 1,7-bisphosphate phosphatase
MRAVFLDRDGVINEDRDDYVKSWKEFIWIKGAKKAIKELNEANLLVIVVTNQSPVGRGIISSDVVKSIHEKIQGELKEMGAWIDAFYYCPALPEEGSPFRKPQPGMILQAQKEHHIELGNSYVIGDSISDIDAGLKTGCKTILVLTGKGKVQLANMSAHAVKPHIIAQDLCEAVKVILNSHDS